MTPREMMAWAQAAPGLDTKEGAQAAGILSVLADRWTLAERAARLALELQAALPTAGYPQQCTCPRTWKQVPTASGRATTAVRVGTCAGQSSKCQVSTGRRANPGQACDCALHKLETYGLALARAVKLHRSAQAAQVRWDALPYPERDARLVAESASLAHPRVALETTPLADHYAEMVARIAGDPDDYQQAAALRALAPQTTWGEYVPAPLPAHTCHERGAGETWASYGQRAKGCPACHPSPDADWEVLAVGAVPVVQVGATITGSRLADRGRYTPAMGGENRPGAHRFATTGDAARSEPDARTVNTSIRGHDLPGSGRR